MTVAAAAAVAVMETAMEIEVVAALALMVTEEVLLATSQPVVFSARSTMMLPMIAGANCEHPFDKFVDLRVEASVPLFIILYLPMKYLRSASLFLRLIKSGEVLRVHSILQSPSLCSFVSLSGACPGSVVHDPVSAQLRKASLLENVLWTWAFAESHAAEQKAPAAGLLPLEPLTPVLTAVVVATAAVMSRVSTL